MAVDKGLKDEAAERREYRDQTNEPMDRPHAFRRREDELRYQRGRETANETRQYVEQKNQLDQEAAAQREFRDHIQATPETPDSTNRDSHNGWKAENGAPSANGWGADNASSEPEHDAGDEVGA